MSDAGHRLKRLLIFSALVVTGSGSLASLAAGQGTPGNLSTDCSAYASVPLPAEAANVPVPKTSPACASYRSYRGIGRPVNFAQARACAWQERSAQQAQLRQNPDEPAAWVVGGSLILADIYVNGAGVPRNVPLALRFACESEEGMARLAFPDIEKLHGAPPAHRPFEFCDYAATTFTMNFCGEYASEIAEARRHRYYDSLQTKMTPEQAAAFNKLLAAEHAYISAHAFEVDQGGSIRAIRTQGSQKILEDLFRAELVHYERKDWPKLLERQIHAAGGQLHRAYEDKLTQLGKQSKEDIENGAVSADGLAKAENAWDAYREAWAAFAKVRYPSAADAIGAQITLDRIRLVKTIG